MKKTIVTLFVSCFFLFACKKNQSVVVEKEINFDQASIKLMDSVRPRLSGTWNMKEVAVKYFAPFTSEIGILKDTTLNDFAAITITSIDNFSNEFYKSSNQVTGVINFKTKTYPIGFRLISNPERIYRKTGPQMLTLFEYRFTNGSHKTEVEEAYLMNLTLIGENYSIEINPDGKTMVWKGLNKAIKSIKFVKN